MGLVRKLIPFLQLRWIDRARTREYARILVLVSLLSIYPFYDLAIGEVGSDFLAFWSAGKLVISGAASTVYDPAATYAAQEAVGQQGVFPFINPPPFLLVTSPLGLMSYPVAWIFWVSGSFMFWFLNSRRLAPELGWQIAAFPGALVAAWHAQTGLFMSGIQAAAAYALRNRPFAAGLCVGALIAKPQLALLFPIALVAGKHWSAFAGATLSAAVLLMLSWLLFDTATILNYWQVIEVGRQMIAGGTDDFFLGQPTVFAAVRVLASVETASFVQAFSSMVMVLVVWRAWSGKGPLEGQLALLMVATPLATPYLFNYDLPFLIIPLCWLIRQSLVQPISAWERPLLLSFYLAPLASRAAASPIGINIMPWMFAAMLWLTWRRLAPQGRSAPVADHAAQESYD